VIVLEGAAPAPPTADAARAVARSLLAEGNRTSVVAKTLADRLGLSRNEAYAIALREAGEGEVD
jgi:hypothetical protein